MEAERSEPRPACPCCDKEDCYAFRFRMDELERQITELSDLNRHLAASAEAFAALAARANDELRENRVKGADRAFTSNGRQVGFGRER